jgi:NADH:ubiquinone oxidoreductase subunit 2 (subunit N)
MLVFLLSLAGVVPTAGFVSKILLLVAAVKSGSLGIILAVSLVLNSVISFVYYGRLARYMYFMKPEDDSRVKEDIRYLIPMAMAVIVILVMGLYPPPVVDLAMDVAGSLL